MESDVRDAMSRAISVHIRSIEELDNYEIFNQIYEVAQVINEAGCRLAFTGIGKSGDVARKIIGTFNSIGIPSYFIHPVEARHGQLGMLQPGGVIILISNSGFTEEIIEFAKIIENFDMTTVSITSNPISEIAQKAEYHINTNVKNEGAVVEFVPMASSTATIIIGDCLANALMTMRNFDRNQHARLHPGGTIGKRLLMDVSSVLYSEIPRTKPSDTLAEVAVKMSKGGKGIAVIQNEQNAVEGVLTDGDVRRLVEAKVEFHEVTAKEVMTTDPVTVLPSLSANETLERMQHHDISHMIVTTAEDIFVGVVHMNDLMNEGFVK